MTLNKKWMHCVTKKKSLRYISSHKLQDLGYNLTIQYRQWN